MIQKASEKLINFLKVAEGFVNCPTTDPPGSSRHAVGHGCQVSGPELAYWRARAMTLEEADVLLRQRLSKFEAAVNRLVKVELTQNEYDAIVSFTYNVGADEDHDGKAEGLGDSTLLKLLNAGDKASVPEQLKLWHWSGGKPNVLTNRRNAEVAIWQGQPTRGYTLSGQA